MRGASSRMRQVAMIGLVAVALSGCFDPGSGPGSGSAEVSDEEAPFQEAFTLQDCVETMVMFMVDPETAQAALPDGFTAADAQAWLGAPAPTGSSIVVATAVQCESSSIAEGGYDESYVAVTIEPPAVEGDRSDAVDLYVVAAGTGQDEVQALHARLGWAVSGTEVTAAASYVPVVTGVGRVADEDGDIFALEATAPPVPLAIEGTYRWWHAASAGISYVDYEIDIETHVGPVTCELRPGSALVEASGESSCTPSNSMGATNQRFDTKGSWHLLGPVPVA